MHQTSVIINSFFLLNSTQDMSNEFRRIINKKMARSNVRYRPNIYEILETSKKFYFRIKTKSSRQTFLAENSILGILNVKIRGNFDGKNKREKREPDREEEKRTRWRGEKEG